MQFVGLNYKKIRYCLIAAIQVMEYDLNTIPRGLSYPYLENNQIGAINRKRRVL